MVQEKPVESEPNLDLIATKIGEQNHIRIDNTSFLTVTKEKDSIKILRDNLPTTVTSADEPFSLRMGRVKYLFSNSDLKSRLSYKHDDLFKYWRLNDIRLKNFEENQVNLKVSGHNPLLLFRLPFRFDTNSYIAVELRYKIKLKFPGAVPGQGRIYWDFFEVKRDFENEKSVAYDIPDNSEFNIYRLVIPKPVNQPYQILRLDLVGQGTPVEEIMLDYVKIYEYHDPLFENKDFVNILKHSENYLSSDILLMQPGEEISFDTDNFQWKNLKVIYSLLSLSGEKEGHIKIKSDADVIKHTNIRESEVLYLNLDEPVTEENLSLVYEAPEGAPPLIINNVSLYREREARPNVVLIILDTLRADHLGCYGYDKNTSPNLDAFAAENVLYENAFAQAPLTPPSHGSIFTSLYPDQHKALKTLLPEFPTLAEVMNEHGYYTTATTGGVYLTRGIGFMQGFDRVRPFDEEWLISRKYEARFNINRAVEDLENYKGPFFMLFHTYQIHSPYIHPEQFDIFYEKQYTGDMSGYLYKDLAAFTDESAPGWLSLRKIVMPDADRKRIISYYDQGIRYTDNELQGLFNYMKKKDYYDDSLIIITSDHGEEFFDHGSWEHGHTLYNEIVKVPLIVKYPESMNLKNMIVKDYVELIDIMPTVMDTAGISPGFHIEGKNLLAGPGENSDAVSIMIDPDGDVFKAVQSGHKGKYKFIHTMDKEVLPDLKYFYMIPPAFNEIYDMKEDYDEQKNLHVLGTTGNMNEDLEDSYNFWLENMDQQENFKWAETALGKESEPVIDAQLREQLEALGYVQ